MHFDCLEVRVLLDEEKATGQSDDMIEYFKWKAERKKEGIDESAKSKQQ